MRCASAVSSTELGRSAAVEAAEAIAHKLDGARADVLLCFLTGHHAESAGPICEYLQTRFEPQCLIGCTAEGVISNAREVERVPGLALWAAHLPGCTVKPFALSMNVLEAVFGEQSKLSVSQLMDQLSLDNARLMLMFGDPFTTPIDALLPAVDMYLPGTPVIGGMASSGRQPGRNRLLFNGRTLETGVVGVSIAGPIRIDSIVSQGCKPIGRPMKVTAAQQNVLVELDDKPALAAFEELLEVMPQEEREKLGHGVFIGRAIDAIKPRLGRGDFLIRGVMGVDRQSGAMAVGDRIAPFTPVQFHVRDAVTAREDLEMMLTAQAFEDRPPIGALLFTCNGRGRNLYRQEHVDVTLLETGIGQHVPIAGFFAAGELGPISGCNFIHGHTASIAIIRQQ